jgi:hypothetical protein
VDCHDWCCGRDEGLGESAHDGGVLREVVAPKCGTNCRHPRHGLQSLVVAQQQAP